MTRLGHGHSWKPFNKLMDGGIFFEILKEGSDRNPRASENPGATHALRVALDIGTRRPINHGKMLAL